MGSDERRPVPAPGPVWHGPASMVGSVIGTLCWALLLLLQVPRVSSWAVNFILPWALGFPLILRKGTVRQVGVGLIASGLAIPTVFALIALEAALTNNEPW